VRVLKDDALQVALVVGFGQVMETKEGCHGLIVAAKR
jgi:hypothetical protein